MERNRVLANLESEISGAIAGRPVGDDALIVTMSGLNAPSESALMSRELIVRFFPFLIGRISRQRDTTLPLPDMAIPDSKPYRISQVHLSMERRGSKIFWADKGSRFGSIVNNILIGEQAGGIAEISLNVGDNKIMVGGQNSPFIFKMVVGQDDSANPLDDQVWLGERFIPVAALYSRICHLASDILSNKQDNRQDLLKKTEEVIKLFAPHPDTIHLLYYFSASPDTFSDIIIAHSVNVAIYTVKLAYGLHYSLPNIIKMGVAALLHDIGMYEIPFEIVNKKGKLSDQEYELIKTHPVKGCHAMACYQGDDFEIINKVIHDHHERIDGRGYPEGASSLSEVTELIAMVDFFEAVTHSRPQRGPITPHEGMRLLLDLREAIFSPKLLKTFLKEFSLFPVFSVVRLNTGEIGQVIRTDPNWPLRPTVRIFFRRDGKHAEQDKEIDLREHNNLYITRDISDRIFIDRYFQL